MCLSRIRALFSKKSHPAEAVSHQSRPIPRHIPMSNASAPASPWRNRSGEEQLGYLGYPPNAERVKRVRRELIEDYFQSEWQGTGQVFYGGKIRILCRHTGYLLQKHEQPIAALIEEGCIAYLFTDTGYYLPNCQYKTYSNHWCGEEENRFLDLFLRIAFQTLGGTTESIQ